MSDLGLQWREIDADLVVMSNDIALDDSLETAVIVSLFSNRYAENYDTLPVGEDDRKGWWGDSVPPVANDRIGSRLWLLGREKQTQSVLVRAEEYARQALEWMIEDKICDSYTVEASIPRDGVLGLTITINRPGKTQVSFRYSYAWAAQEVKRG